MLCAMNTKLARMGVGAGKGSEPGTWVTLKPGTWVTLLLCGTEVDRAVEGNDAHAG